MYGALKKLQNYKKYVSIFFYLLHFLTKQCLLLIEMFFKTKIEQILINFHVKNELGNFTVIKN